MKQPRKILLFYADSKSSRTFKEIHSKLTENGFKVSTFFGGEAESLVFGENLTIKFREEKEVQVEEVLTYFHYNLKHDPKRIYCSDLPYINDKNREKYYLLKTHFICRYLEEEFRNDKNVIVFIVGGGSIIGNCAKMISEKYGIESYRIPTLNYLDTNPNSNRFIFYSSNLYHLSSKSIDKKSQRWLYSVNKAESYYEKIKNKEN